MVLQRSVERAGCAHVCWSLCGWGLSSRGYDSWFQHVCWVLQHRRSGCCFVGRSNQTAPVGRASLEAQKYFNALVLATGNGVRAHAPALAATYTFSCLNHSAHALLSTPSLRRPVWGPVYRSASCGPLSLPSYLTPPPYLLRSVSVAGYMNPTALSQSLSRFS